MGDPWASAVNPRETHDGLLVRRVYLLGYFFSYVTEVL